MVCGASCGVWGRCGVVCGASCGIVCGVAVMWCVGVVVIWCEVSQWCVLCGTSYNMVCEANCSVVSRCVGLAVLCSHTIK